MSQVVIPYKIEKYKAFSSVINLLRIYYKIELYVYAEYSYFNPIEINPIETLLSIHSMTHRITDLQNSCNKYGRPNLFEKIAFYHLSSVPARRAGMR